MCLAVPGKIVSIASDGLMTMAEVDFCGVRRSICVDTVDDAAVGRYVVAHAGVAISVMDEESALEIVSDLEKLAAGGGESV